MVITQIPKNSRFFATSTEFLAVYNAVTLGYYDFTNTPTCQNIVTTEIQPGSLYLVESLSLGGNIPEIDFTGSIDIFPKITLKNSKRQDFIYRYPIPIPQYFDGLPSNAFFISDTKDAQLTISMSGRHAMLPSMIGVTDLKIMVSLNIYAIDDRDFVQAFRDNSGSGLGNKLRGV